MGATAPTAKMAPLPRGCDGSKSYLLKLTGCICRSPGRWHLFRIGTGQNGSRPGYSETAGLLTRRVAMGRKGKAARRAHTVVTSQLIALLVIPLWAAWGLAPQAPLSGPIPTDLGLKVAFIGDTANGTDFRSVLALRLDEGEDTSEICAVCGIADEGHFQARVCGNGPTERCLRRQAPRSPKRDDQKRDEQRGDNGVRSAGGLSLPTHGDPPGQKTGGLRISWPASVLTRTAAKEMPAARGAAYASGKFEQVRFRAVAAAREGCHFSGRRRRAHPPPSIPTSPAG